MRIEELNLIRNMYKDESCEDAGFVKVTKIDICSHSCCREIRFEQTIFGFTFSSAFLTMFSTPMFFFLYRQTTPVQSGLQFLSCSSSFVD